jgi:hypothetical protein
MFYRQRLKCAFSAQVAYCSALEPQEPFTGQAHRASSLSVEWPWIEKPPPLLEYTNTNTKTGRLWKSRRNHAESEFSTMPKCEVIRVRTKNCLGVSLARKLRVIHAYTTRKGNLQPPRVINAALTPDSRLLAT